MELKVADCSGNRTGMALPWPEQESRCKLSRGSTAN